MSLPAVWVLLCKTWHISSFLGFLDFFLEITDGTLEICWGGCCCCPTVTRLLAVPETGGAAKWTAEFVCSDGCSTWGMINPFLPIF